MRILLLILVLLPIPLYAQISGVLGGAISYPRPKFGYPRAGVAVGISLRQNINDNIFITESGLFRLDGYFYKADLPTEISSKGDTIRDLGYKSICDQVNYIEIPLMINFITKSGKVKPYFSLGISPKFTVYTAKRISVQYRDFEFRNLELTNHVDLNTLAAIGFETTIFKRLVRIESRYNHGLVTILEGRKFSSFTLFCFIR